MRSWLFVPGNRPAMIDKARASGADVVIIDLEDSVMPDDKSDARQQALAALRAPRRGHRLWIRVNALDTEQCQQDVAMALSGGADGLVLPKALGGDSIRALIGHAEALGGRCPPVLAVATETAQALFGLGSYGGLGESLHGLSWGAEDLSADIGSSTSRDSQGALTGPYVMARNLMLAGAVAAGVQPVDAVWTDFRDTQGLEAECLAALRDGFTGKMAIHPAQVPVINRCFTPSDEDVAEARRVVAAFEAMPGRGAVSLDGKMLDIPHLKRARRLLARWRELSQGV